MSKVPDAWEDEWSTIADDSTNPIEPEPKKVSSRVTKAQRRAQNSEFNKQLWAEAEGPQEPNYFLQSRNVVPLRSEFKPPPILLSRKGPIIQSTKPAAEGVLSPAPKQDSSEDEELDEKTKALSLAERQAQAAKDREVKQRKYEERRQEIFGTGSNNATNTTISSSRSGNTSPASLTPPSSRSATPNRGKTRGGRRGGGSGVISGSGTQSQQSRTQQRELYEPSYTPKPDSTYIKRREIDAKNPRSDEIQPVRAPKGPDGSGRGGFGFANRRGHHNSTGDSNVQDSNFLRPG